MTPKLISFIDYEEKYRMVFEEINPCRSIRNAVDIHMNVYSYKFIIFAQYFLRICLFSARNNLECELGTEQSILRLLNCEIKVTNQAVATGS